MHAAHATGVRWRVCLLWLATAAFSNATPSAHALPEGWQSLPAEQFVEAATEFFASPDSTDAGLARDVTAHGWSRFLNAPGFIEREPLRTVARMVAIFVPRASSVAGFDPQAAYEDVAARYRARLAEATSEIVGLEFAGLRELTQASSATGMTDQEAAAAFASWVRSNAWQQLPLRELVYISNHLGWSDRANPAQMSARWTGSITAPASGEYVFEVVRQYARDPEFSLWINEVQVLDTRSAAARTEQFFASDAVRLEGGKPTSFRFEMNNDASVTGYSRECPAAALLWRPVADEARRALTPPQAFAPPAGFAGGAQGLKGEYFAAPGFQQPVMERLDASLEFVWTWGHVAPKYAEEYDEIRAYGIARLLDGDITPEEADPQSYLALSHFAGLMTLSQRAALVQQLQERPEFLAKLSDYHLSQLMYAIYMLPKDDHVDLLGQWAALRPAPVFQAGDLYRFDTQSYAWNWQFYWLMGTFFQGPYWADALLLWEEYLHAEDGSCRLPIAYLSAFAAGEARQGRIWRTYLEEALAALPDTGDARSSWLLASAFAEEMATGTPQPQRAIRRLTEAMLVADSDELRFRLLEEAAARLASVGAAQTLEDLLDAHSETFDRAERQQQRDRWMAAAATQRGFLQQRAAATASRRRDLRRAELERRVEHAQAQGIQSEVARLQNLLGALPADK